MTPRFLDTAYLLGLELDDDIHHASALAHWQRIGRHCPRLLTTSNIFEETVTFLNNRGRHDKALKIGKTLLEHPQIELIHVDERLFFAGWELLKSHADKAWSLTDCISFVVMRERAIETAFTFDHHFTQAGFLIEPH